VKMLLFFSPFGARYCALNSLLIYIAAFDQFTPGDYIYRYTAHTYLFSQHTPLFFFLLLLFVVVIAPFLV
jgi:hypothetical protein